MTAAEAAPLLGCDPARIRTWHGRGALRTSQLGDDGELTVSRAEVEEIIADPRGWRRSWCQPTSKRSAAR